MTPVLAEQCANPGKSAARSASLIRSAVSRNACNAQRTFESPLS